MRLASFKLKQCLFQSKNLHRFFIQPKYQHNTLLKSMTSKNENDDASSSKNTKKRSLKELENKNSDNESDCDLEPPTNKKRKLNTDDSPKPDLKNDDDEDDDLKQDKATSIKAKSTSIAKAEQFKICCYNLNGVRAANKHGLEDYLQKEDADIVCFSEMKARKDQNPCTFRGYQIFWNECTEKAGYAGTAVLSKTKPLNVVNGIGCEDAQGRAITLEFETFYLINTYVPNSGQGLKFKDRRIKWDKAMKEYLEKLQKKKPIIWTGDLNVAILDFDVYDGETNKNRKKSPGFTPYERENFRNLTAELDLIDTYRHLYPKERKSHFTFFSKRSRGTDMKKECKGWRLDYFMISKSLVNIIEDVQVRKDESCSDHVPLILTMTDPNVALS